MHINKLLLLCLVTIVALFSSVAEAKRKHKKHQKKSNWRTMVHSHCKVDGQATFAIGGLLTNEMKLSIIRAINEKVDLMVFLDPKSFVKKTKGSKSNIRFIRRYGKKISIGVLPYNKHFAKGKNAKKNAKRAVKSYKKAQILLEKVIRAKPLVAYVSQKAGHLTKRIVSALNKDFIVVGHTTQFTHAKKNTREDSLIIVQAPNFHSLQYAKKHTEKAWMHHVSFAKCIKSAIYDKATTLSRKAKAISSASSLEVSTASD